jgi:hypothetical protein
MLKNAGLGHLHIVQNKLIPSDGPMPTVTIDLFNTLDRMNWPTEKCKEWSAERFRTLWGMFLDRSFFFLFSFFCKKNISNNLLKK